VFWILAGGACYYLATRIAWVLCFPDSKVSLFFPPHAVLISILLACPHPALVGLHAGRRLQSLLRHAAGALAASLRIALRGFRCREECFGGRGIRMFIKSPFHRITLREASSLS
jgi:hypothetical protein